MTVCVTVDRALPVPIGIQIKGQIEYGIVSGTLKPGARLPSVRELAASEGVAHVTVSHVYRDLKREGLIVVRPGRGTYVAGAATQPGNGKAELHRLVDTMVTRALKSGYRPAEISHMVTARLTSGHVRRPRIALVGVFHHATKMYAYDMASLLTDLVPEIVPYTLDALHAGGANPCGEVCQADVVLTLANRVKEVQELLGSEAPVVRGLTFVVHPETIARLRALPGDARLGVVSTFAEFLPTMLHGVAEYAVLERPPFSAVLADHDRVCTILAQVSAVVYATGSETILDALRPGVPAIEYLHTPERSSVESVRPLLERFSGRWAHGQGNGRWNRKK